ncbi:MAG: hypothetical protein KKF80_01415, partial [Candidatus Omnitrophica bacterium]|nr:hypothetical protein [Candidatus Omnitrophota bacterium]
MMNLFLIPLLFFFYDCCFFLGLVAYLPFYFYRKKITFRALREKFGFITLTASRQQRIWIHVVSVGEAILIAPLVTRLRELYDNPIVISTTTLTGNKIARDKYSSFAQIIFFPFDFSFIVVRALRLIRPQLFIAVETEIWPNLFYRLKCRGIPIVIVNGRISDKAFRRYRLLGPIIEQVLKNCSYVGVQSHIYRERFLALGCPSEKITISGNLKFESIIPDQEKLSVIRKLYVPLLKPEGNLVVVAASTHHPEEEIVLEILRDTLDFGNPYTLVIAPRHTTRVPAIEESVRRFGFSPVRVSTPDTKIFGGGGKSVYILDTLGELLY